jgi:hypothetical protein
MVSGTRTYPVDFSPLWVAEIAVEVLWRPHCRSDYIWVPLYEPFGARSNTISLIPTGLSCTTCGDPGLSGMPSTEQRPIDVRPYATAAPRQVGLRLAPRAGLWAGAGSTNRPDGVRAAYRYTIRPESIPPNKDADRKNRTHRSALALASSVRRRWRSWRRRTLLHILVVAAHTSAVDTLGLDRIEALL